jgi:serine protease Do
MLILTNEDIHGSMSSHHTLCVEVKMNRTKRKPALWLALLVTMALVALTGCGAINSLSARPVHANVEAMPQKDTALPEASPTPEPGTASTITADTIAALEGTLERVYQNVSPSVVYVEVLQQAAESSLPDWPFGMPQQSPQESPYQHGSGSGFVWDRTGHIVTNNHVVEGAEKIEVTFADGTIVPATLVGANRDSDLAVIKVDMPASELHPVSVSDSAQVKVGEIAIAIGNPFGLENTMTVGFISALGRTLPVESDGSTGPTYRIPDIIQTDAPINPGNSGGVLVNDQGEVIGVTAAIASPVQASVGIGFAIPSAIVQRIVPALIQDGHYAVPWLGISGTSLNPDLAQGMDLQADQHGALVIDVTPGSPADEAGLRGSDRDITVDGEEQRVGGDVITTINGQSVESFDDLIAYLFHSTSVGQQVTLTVLRNGQEHQIQVTLRERPSQESEPSPITEDVSEWAWLGIRGMTVSPEIAQAMNLDENQEGVLIVEVTGDSPADKAGLQGSHEAATIQDQQMLIGGDVIVAWDGKTIAQIAELQTLVRTGRPGQQVTVTVLRGDVQLDLQVTLEAYPAP